MGRDRRERPPWIARTAASGAALALFLAASGGSAGAVSLAGVTLSNTSSVAPAGLAADDRDVTTQLVSTTACGGGCSAFGTRFSGSALGETDGLFESGAVDFEWSYEIGFDVVAAASEAWSLTIAPELLGALALGDDSAGGATAELGAFTGAYTGPGTASGGLDLAGLGTVSAASGGGAAVDAGEQTASLVVSGVGPASGADRIQVAFRATGRLESQCGGFLCLFPGDEAAVSLGETGTPPTDDWNGSFDAGAYSGSGARAPSGDGHSVSFSVASAVPEPHASLLVALGLLGLAVGGRRPPGPAERRSRTR